jgi:hypothetical protein
MVKGLKMLDDCVLHIERLKFDVVARFSTALTQEYAVEKNGVMVIACETLGTKVADVMKYRNILRRVAGEIPGASAEEVLEKRSMCTIA